MKKLLGEIHFDVPRYNSFNAPEGFLIDTPACHALFHYCITLKRLQQEKKDDLSYEGDASPGAFEHNYVQLFSSIALAYGVQPEEMIKHWPSVDMQCVMMGSPKLVGKYRMDSVPEIKTQ